MSESDFGMGLSVPNTTPGIGSSLGIRAGEPGTEEDGVGVGLGSATGPRTAGVCLGLGVERGFGLGATVGTGVAVGVGVATEPPPLSALGVS